MLAGSVCGVITAVFSIFQPWGGCACCLTYIGAGILYVWHFSNTQEPGFTMTSGEGAGSGALAGVMAGLVATVFGIALQQAGIVPGPEEIVNQLYENSEFTGEQLDMIEGIILSPFLYVASAFITAIIGGVLGAIGGALGVNLFAKGDL